MGCTELAGMETLPLMSTSQAASFTMRLSASPSLWAVGGQGQGSPDSLPCSD